MAHPFQFQVLLFSKPVVYFSSELCSDGHNKLGVGWIGQGFINKGKAGIGGMAAKEKMKNDDLDGRGKKERTLHPKREEKPLNASFWVI